MKKDTMLKSTLILATAALVARALGIFQRVPLDYLMSDKGNIYYNNANNIYLLLLGIATAGIPSAVSQMVSSRYSLGRYKEADQVYKAALWFGFGSGLLITVLLWEMAPAIADILHEPQAISAIRAIAPSLLFFPTIAMMRGYFQGRQYVSAGGISQIVEQILRVFTSLLLAFLFFHFDPNNNAKIAAGASFGSVFGSLGAFAVMLYYSRQLQATDRLEQRDIPTGSGIKYRTIYTELFSLSVPVVLTAVTVQLLYTMDNMMIKSLTVGHFDLEKINHWAAVYGMNAQSIAGIPIILAIALSQSLVPHIAASYALNDMKRVEEQSSLALKMALFSGMPLVLLLGVGAYSVNGFLFKEATGSQIVLLLTLGTIFQIGMMVTNSILLAIHAPEKATLHSITGIIMKVLLSFATASLFGVYGIIIATTFCFIWTFGFNILSLRKYFNFVILGASWIPFFITIGLTGVGIGMTQWLSLSLCVSLVPKLAFFVTCLFMGIVLVLLYPTLLIVTGLVQEKEIAGYPPLVRRMLSPYMKLKRRNLFDSNR